MRNRLREIRERAGLTQEELGALVGHDKTVISRLELGKRRITLEWMKKLSDALKVSPVELIDVPVPKPPFLTPNAEDIFEKFTQTREGVVLDPAVGSGGTFSSAAPSKTRLRALSHGDVIEADGIEYSRIPRFDAALSAGAGSIIDPAAEPIGYHLAESQWLRTVTRSLPDRLAVLRVAGDSMEDTLQDGDWVLIDRSQTRISRDGIYALRVADEGCWVKRLTLNLGDRRVRIISDNPRYPMQELRADDLALIGRVVWIVGRRL